MEKQPTNHYSSKNLGHLGILAGIMKKTKLIERIDKRMPISKAKGAKVTMGERISAMVFNAIGFIDSRLYMFPDFLGHKPVNKLLGPHLTAKDFTDDALGRCLDSIYDYGPSQLVSHLAFEIGAQFNLLGKTIHIDTTTLTLYGDYSLTETKAVPPPKITYGYAKNKRMDLKQVILNLAISTKADLPLFMAAHDGNASDQKTLVQAAQHIEKCCKTLENTPDFIYVADSAAYESCLKEANNIHWISRVPMQRQAAKQFIKNRASYRFTSIDDGYKISCQQVQVGGVEQRWLLVYSQQARDRAEKTLTRRKEKESLEIAKTLKQLSHQQFSCGADAAKALKALSKQWVYHQIASRRVSPIEQYAKRGKPQSGAKKHIVGYHIHATVSEATEKLATILATKSHFIIATNQLDASVLSDQDMLQEYKGQQKVERGFAFIKDHTFEVSSVFLKKPSRISALMAVMVLSLFIYSLTQYLLRTTLQSQGESIPNQLKKPTQSPTGKWVFFLFRSVQVLEIKTMDTGPPQAIVINLTPLLERILGYFGKETMALYDIAMPKKD